MKNKLTLLTCFIFGLMNLLYAQTLNYPPSSTITMPHSNAYFKAGTDVEIHVYATDLGKSANNGAITKVEFYNGTSLIGTATTHSNYTYKYTWTCVPMGTYTLKAKATNDKGVSFTSTGVIITVGTSNVTPKGMSACKGKYLANIIPGAPQTKYNEYWNGVTAENNCKWGPVEGTRDQFNWNGADVCYNHAKNNNMMFRYHAGVWASQYPTWLTSLSTADAKAEVVEYLTAIAARFPLADQIDVLNEQLGNHQNDNQKFRDLFGGAANTSSTDFTWQIWLFTQARALFPNTKLILNDYGLENDPNAINMQLNLLKALRDRGLVDGFGTQAHCFNIDGLSASGLKSSLDLMAKAGIPIYVTELDLNGGQENDNNEAAQLASFQTHFPVYWDHAAVAGISIWGYITGATWIGGTGLMSSNGTEKSALTWLKGYVSGKSNVGYPSCATGACTTVGNPPTVSIISPSNNETFAANATITLTADAKDSDGTISKVEFYNGLTKLGESTTNPYEYIWTNVAEGEYTLTAVATDDSQNKTTSSEISIIVGNPSTELISNGEFDNGTTGWNLQNNSTGTSTMSVITTANQSGSNALKICPTNAGTADWHIQLQQVAPLVSGKKYEISFMAKAEADRSINVGLQQNENPYTIYNSQLIDLTTSNQTFNLSYTSNVTDAGAMLKFFIGNNITCVYLDKISVKEKNVVTDANVSIENWETNVFPNPFSQTLRINAAGNFNYQLMSSTGQIIESGNATDETTFSKEVPKGIYLLKITQNNKSKIVKLVKE